MMGDAAGSPISALRVAARNCGVLKRTLRSRGLRAWISGFGRRHPSISNFNSQISN
jgi:hypothetical protein